MSSNGNGGVEQAEQAEQAGSSKSDDAAQSPQARARAPYKAPLLRRLGSVRNLTLGSPMGALMDGLPGGMKP